jgi:hypothetical protein
MKRGPGKQGTHARPLMRFSDTQAFKALNSAAYEPSSEWNLCRYIIAESEDQCNIGSWVFGRSPIDVSFSFEQVNPSLTPYNRMGLLLVKLLKF